MSQIGVVIDYETPPAQPAQLWALGVSGVAVYNNREDWPKDVTIPYIEAGLAVPGFSFVFIFENTINTWQGGSAQGALDGADWLAGMNERQAAIPSLATAPAMPTFDTSIAPTSFDTAAAYLAAFRAAVSPHPVLSVYGEGALIEFLVSQGLIVMGWESESKSFPGNMTPTVHTTMVQIVNHAIAGLNGSYDYDAILAADWGQWPRPHTDPQPEVDNEMFYPARLAASPPYRGRDVGLAFNESIQTLLLTNGGEFQDNGVDPAFDKVWLVTQWPDPNSTGVTSSAKLIGAHTGALSYGERGDGTGAVLTASGDGGTFFCPFKNVLPVPTPMPAPVPTPDFAALAAAVAPLLHVESTVSVAQ